MIYSVLRDHSQEGNTALSLGIRKAWVELPASSYVI